MYAYILVCIFFIVIFLLAHNGSPTDGEQIDEKIRFDKVKKEIITEIRGKNYSENLIYAALSKAFIYNTNSDNEQLLLANPIYIFLFEDLFYLKSYYRIKDLDKYKSENQILSIRKILLELKYISELKYYKINSNSNQIFIFGLETGENKLLLTFPLETNSKDYMHLINILTNKSVKITEIGNINIKEYKALANPEFEQIEQYMYFPIIEDNISYQK